jgi:hypothetical protein
MASFPGSKVHRVSRRRLGKGQSPQRTAVTLTPTVNVAVVTLTGNVPFIVSGPIPLLTSGGGPIVSQVQTSPTTVNVVFSSTQAAATVSLIANCGAIQTYQGGGNSAFSITF